tara:strand:- start:201 stop:479 length:279 start_codon:yes stop_codon:yes gene_type:complete
MNRSDLVEIIHQNNELLSKNDIQESSDLIFNYISNNLSSGNRVEIRGFGSFSIRERKKRIARNPATGLSISVEKKNHPYFRAAKALKETLNQ